MCYDTKTMNRLINARIKRSDKLEYVGRDIQKKDMLIALIDYLIDRRAGYRYIASKHNMTKTKFEQIVCIMPIKFNKKFAQKLYKKVIYNRVQDYVTDVLTDKEVKSLTCARNKLIKKTYLAFDKMSSKDIDKLLWHSA